MNEKTWTGGVFLKDEGGYEIVLRALQHYIRRLRNISNTPELSDSPMFVQLVQHEANKNGPIVVKLCEQLKQSLTDSTMLASLQDNTVYFQKALDSYKSDIIKSIQKDEYYSKMIDIKYQNDNEIRLIDDAKKRLVSFSE
jgi:hypothetical protein